MLPLVLLASRVHAQGSGPHVAVDAGLTLERLVSEYRFENDSSFGTAGLVPHFFVQHYESTQPWLVVRAHYPLGRRSAETAVGLAPAHRAFGSDVDTFFQPGGDVATSGTLGDVRLQGLSIDQRVWIARAHAWNVGVGGRYTRRRADFLPADRVVTHTQPPSVTRQFITTRETTRSHEIRVGLSVESIRTVAAGWRLEVSGAAWPAVRGRLVTDLADKYPGEGIVFEAVDVGGEARVALSRRIGPASLVIDALAGGLLPYRQSARLRQHTGVLGVSFVLDTFR